MRLPVDNLSIEVSRLVLTEAAAAAASSAEVFVAIEIAIEPNLTRYCRSYKNVVASLARFAEGNICGQLLDRPKVSETLPFSI